SRAALASLASPCCAATSASTHQARASASALLFLTNSACSRASACWSASGWSWPSTTRSRVSTPVRKRVGPGTTFPSPLHAPLALKGSSLSDHLGNHGLRLTKSKNGLTVECRVARGLVAREAEEGDRGRKAGGWLGSARAAAGVAATL